MGTKTKSLRLNVETLAKLEEIENQLRENYNLKNSDEIYNQILSILDRFNQETSLSPNLKSYQDNIENSLEAIRINMNAVFQVYREYQDQDKIRIEKVRNKMLVSIEQLNKSLEEAQQEKKLLNERVQELEVELKAKEQEVSNLSEENKKLQKQIETYDKMETTLQRIEMMFQEEGIPLKADQSK